MLIAAIRRPALTFCRLLKQLTGRSSPMRVYRFRELKLHGVPFTRKHITTLEKNSKFPAHFDLGENTVAWVADEVDAWVEARVRGRQPARAA
jgi:prophage regulatory protein